MPVLLTVPTRLRALRNALPLALGLGAAWGSVGNAVPVSEVGDATAKRALARLPQAANKLSTAEAACLAGWTGPTSELSLRYAREMIRGGRRADAAAEAIELLASDPASRGAKDAAKLANEAGRKPTAPGGVHHSVFHLAVLAPQSGDYATYGHSLLAGVEIALAEYNASARLPIRFVSYDTEGEPWRAASLGRQALDAGAGVLIGEVLSAPTLVLAGLSQARGAPLLSPSATEESVGEAGPAVFQSGLSQAEQGRALARYAVNDLHLARIALTDTAGELGAAFTLTASRLGAVVAHVPAPAGSRDARVAVNALQRARAEGLVLPADPDGAELWLGAIAREHYPVKLLGTEALDPQNLRPEVRKHVEGLTLVGLDYALPESTFRRVDAAAQKRFGVSADRLVRHGYLTAGLIARTIGAGAVSPGMLVEALSRRVAEASRPDRSARGFLHFADNEAVVPIYVARRGSMVRVH